MLVDCELALEISWPTIDVAPPRPRVSGLWRDSRREWRRRSKPPAFWTAAVCKAIALAEAGALPLCGSIEPFSCLILPQVTIKEP